MDNNSNFEQQFKQNLKATTPVQPVYEARLESTGGSKLPLVIAIALAAITLVESIALVITLNNYFSYSDDYGEDEGYVANSYYDSVYSYNDDGDLTAMNLSCAAEDGSYYKLDTTNKYEFHNTTGAIAGTGTYAVTNDSLISLSGSDKVLYYNGFDIADGLTIYTCEEIATESNEE